MTEHNLFYYPYASFTDKQFPLLKVSALYFDNLFILDPEKATGGTIGPGDVADEVAMLELGDVDILQRVSPEEVLETYENPIADAIRADMEDPEFLELCARLGRRETWTIALAKVPRSIRDDPEHRKYGERKPRDQAMQRLMGSVPKSLLEDWSYLEGYAETAMPYLEYGPFDELRSIGDREIEYRYADFPLPLGESIMMNHALFAGLLHSDATPIADDPFHNDVLGLKLRRATEIPALRGVLSERARRRKLGAEMLASTALTDSDLKLPILDPGIAMEDVLEYRRDNSDTLTQVRDKLGLIARRIESEPWSKEFADELEHNTIPEIIEDLNEARAARDAWLRDKRGKRALKAASITVGAAVAVLTLFTVPVMPVALAIASLEVASGAIIPGLEWINELREDKAKQSENGFRYLLTM